MTSSRASADLRQRVDELEDDLGRATLIVHALAEACVRKGLLGREEIAAIVDEVDLLDGKADGKLDPAALRSPDEQRAKRPPSAERHLHDLESQETQSPGEFLSDLERQAGEGDSS